MNPALRKLLLTAHVICSVGWIGAIATFLVLAVAGVSSANNELIRAAYLGMELTGWSVIVPLSFASLLSGVVQSLSTSWGLVRHYWVFAKLLITLLATVLLLLHMQPTTRLAALASTGTLARAEGMHGLQVQLVADAGLALVVLTVATMLAVYKPPGITKYGARMQFADGDTPATITPTTVVRLPRWVKVLAALMIILVFAVRFLFSGPGTHGPAAHLPW